MPRRHSFVEFCPFLFRVSWGYTIDYAFGPQMPDRGPRRYSFAPLRVQFFPNLSYLSILAYVNYVLLSPEREAVTRVECPGFFFAAWLTRRLPDYNTLFINRLHTPLQRLATEDTLPANNCLKDICNCVTTSHLDVPKRFLRSL